MKFLRPVSLHIAGFLLNIFFLSSAFGATYYVKNTGSDSNTGLSDGQAWQTISKVNSTVSGTGDDVYFNSN